MRLIRPLYSHHSLIPPMKRFSLAVLAFVLIASLPQVDAVKAHWANPFFRVRADHDIMAQAGAPFTFVVYGAGDRELFGAEVTVFYNGTRISNGMTDEWGIYTFEPAYLGRHIYTIKQGRYFNIGGEFDIVPRQNITPANLTNAQS